MDETRVNISRNILPWVRGQSPDMLGERRRLFHIHGTLLLTFGFSFHHLTTQTLAIPQSNVTAAWLNNIVSTRCKWKGLERMNVPDHDSLPLAECELEFPHHRYTIHRLGPFRFESTVGRMQNRGLYNLTHHRGYEATWLFRKGRTSIVGAGAWAVDAANPERYPWRLPPYTITIFTCTGPKTRRDSQLPL